MNDTHKYVGTHPQDLDGRMLEPGETFTPTDEQLAHDSMVDMLDNGLVMTLNKSATTAPATPAPEGGEGK